MDTVKITTRGRRQTIRLPEAYRLPGDEVYIRREGAKIVLVPKRTLADWWREGAAFPAPDFPERDQPRGQQQRQPDPLVEKLKALRRQHAARCGFDLRRLFADLQREEQACGRPVVRRPAVRLAPTDRRRVAKSAR